MIRREWDPAELEEIRHAYETDKRATMEVLADRYGTSGATIHQIIHRRNRFNPDRVLISEQARIKSEMLLGHTAGWYRDEFTRQHDEVDDYDGLHRLSEPYDWQHVTEDPMTSRALADLCNVLYFRRFRYSTIKRMGESDRKREYITAGADEKRDIAVARLVQEYGLSLEFFSDIFAVSLGSPYLWLRTGRRRLAGG